MSDWLEIDPQYVHSRRDALADLHVARNERMDTMEQLYLLDVWEGEAQEGELRVSSPRAWNTVEGFRTLLLTQPPVIDVPASELGRVEQDRADAIEKFLYGCWSRADVMGAADEAEFYANCLGLGVLKVVYDETQPEGELPIVCQALDPRNVYTSWDPRKRLRAMEVAHSWERPRREIEAEWGRELPGRDEEEATAALDGWLDEEVCYTEYWREVVVEEEEVIEPEEDEEELELQEPLGIMGQLAQRVRAVGQRLWPGAGSEEGEELEAESEDEESEEEPEPETRTVRRRRILHCVEVEGAWMKEPTFVPGYDRMPFLFWAGVRTPLRGADRCQSVLFPIAAGAAEGDQDVIGVAGAENMLLAMEMRIVQMFANNAMITNDQDLADAGLDYNPGALNYARGEVKPLAPVGTAPGVDKLQAKLNSLADDATLPPAMRGQYVGDVSGLYLSAITNPVMMRIAQRQRDRERAFQDLNALILALTEEYAPTEGWLVYGEDQMGGEFETRLRPSEIGGYRRNRVKLSASLPKDTAGEVMTLSGLVDKKLLSRRTAINEIQQIKRLSGQSAQDEMQMMLIESILFDDDETRRTLAEAALREYDAALADQVAQRAEQARTARAEMAKAMEGLGGGGQGPMQGMPPGVVPPQSVPPAVGQRNPAAMMRMQGEGPPRPPGPGGPR